MALHFAVERERQLYKAAVVPACAHAVGKGKKADLVKARQICAYLLCEMLSLPLVAVGNILGGRDHTTIMYARDKMEKLASLNDRVAKEIDDIKNIVLKK